MKHNKRGFTLNRQAIVNAMQKQGIATLRELARRSGVPESTLYHITGGIHTRVYLKTVQKLAKTLQVPVSELVKM